MRLFWTSLLFSTLIPFASAQTNASTVVQMLVPGFTVEELPVNLSNQNNLRFAPDGTLTSLGYDGRIWRLRDTDGDGLEDSVEPIWSKTTLSVPLGMAWSTQGLLVTSKSKVSLLKDTNGDGVFDVEETIVSGWPSTDVGSGGVDATAVTLDAKGNVYFGLLVADYANAYRLRNRKDLKPEEVVWLKEQGRWKEPTGPDANEDQFSLYDINSRRGTIQKWDPRTKQLFTVATGIRVPVALAFNRAGDLFNTDQEGETWMPDGNPLDELNHIISGRNYGFPPSHPKWLPNIKSDQPVVSFGPQHQSACGLVFNEPSTSSNTRLPVGETAVPLPITPSQKLFGPKEWEGDALVAGESRAKIWRVRLSKTQNGYVGKLQTLARVSMLTMDLAISPRGELYLCCHSGPPDWGTGPQGKGKLFKISYKNPQAPIPLSVWPTSSSEVKVAFDKPLDTSVTKTISSGKVIVEFGEYVAAGDLFEVLKPPYAVVQQQDATPRGQLAIRGSYLEDAGRTLVLKTDPHPFVVSYAVALPGIKGAGQPGAGTTTYLDYDFTESSQPLPKDLSMVSPVSWNQLVAWAPKGRVSAGTNSRPPSKPDGDWEHGRDLFLGAQLQCAKCHRIRGEGGTAGPDLSNLIHRDAASVLRDVREPGATLHPDYVTYQVAMKDGSTFNGFVRSQMEEAIQIFDAEGKVTVLPRVKIESVKPTELSLMPSGLLDGLKEKDVRDLLTFLMWEPPNRSPDFTKSILSELAKQNTQVDPGAISELRLVLVASRQDHGLGQHDYPNWQTNWTRQLSSSERKIVVETAWEWPSQAQFDQSKAVVFYFWNHDWSPTRRAQMNAFLERGGGIALIHSAIIDDQNPELLAEQIGLSAHPKRTGYRHMPFELLFVDRNHPITRGLPERLELLDEPYWPLIGNVSRSQILATAVVDGESRPLIWTRQQGKGRIFASIPGHYTWTLNDPIFRQVLLRGIAWVAGENPARLQTFP